LVSNLRREQASVYIHLTLAVITLFDTPEPSSNVT
jgi:hypothetical protein